MRLQVQRYTRGAWRAYKTYATTVSKGKYAARVSLVSGTFRVRALPAAGYAAKSSTWTKVRVR